jgi:ABC-type transporter Mla maintaining outer membrane lipid asymmetry ATPase subunit MlaF
MMIEIHDLTLAAPDGRLTMEGLDLIVPRGGNQVVTGPSGSGKSQLMKVIAGTERPLRGRVRIGGRNVWPDGSVFALAGRISLGFAFASGGLLSNLTLRENIALPLTFLGTAPAEQIRRTEQALERMDLQAVGGLRPHAVSASARKLANLARVLALEPQLILLDDPLESLDAGDRALAQSLIRDWGSDGSRTLVMAAEDADPFSQLNAARLQLPAAPMIVESP